MSTAAVSKPPQALRRQRPSISTRHTLRIGNNDSGDDELADKTKEPFVRDTDFILKKFSGKKPSLVVHIYARHFRFANQPMNFAYEGGMGVLIRHLQTQTVPHDLIKELSDEDITWYDGKTWSDLDVSRQNSL